MLGGSLAGLLASAPFPWAYPCPYPDPPPPPAGSCSTGVPKAAILPPALLLNKVACAPEKGKPSDFTAPLSQTIKDKVCTYAMSKLKDCILGHVPVQI